MGVFNELQKIWSRIRGIEQRLEGYDEVVIVSALPTNPIDGVMYQFNGNFYYHLNGTWHIAVTVPSDVNQLTDTSGLLTGVPTTAEDLETLMDAGELVPGRTYAITDYVSSWNIFDGGTMDIIEEQAGIGEILFVTAVSTTKLHHIAKSAMYPEDIIYFSLKLLDDRDIGFGDGAGTPISIFKGMIYYRKDTLKNVSRGYDFRNVKFRSFSVSAEAHVPGSYATFTGQVSGMTTDVTLTADTIGVIGNTISLLGDGVKTIATLVSDWNTANPANTVTVTVGDDTQIPNNGFYLTLDDGVDTVAYVENDVCLSTDGAIYKCISDITGTDDPSVDAVHWKLWLELNDPYVSWTADKSLFDLDSINTDNLIIDDEDYIDEDCFGGNYTYVKDDIRGSINLDVAIGERSYSTILDNHVIRIQDGGSQNDCRNNYFGMSFNIRHLGEGLLNNTIKGISCNCLFTKGMIFNTSVHDYAFSDLNLKYANNIYGSADCTIYNDVTSGIKLSYMDNGVIIIADVTD